MTTFTTAMTTELHEQLARLLLSKPGQEELCFALWYPSSGATRMTALLQRMLSGSASERILHGNVSFTPEFVERALGEALRNKAGVALLHSHLGPGWQAMSEDDIAAERLLAPRVLAATGLPLVGLTLGTDGAWSARFWEKTAPRQFSRNWCDRVRVVGEYLQVTYDEDLAPAPKLRPELDRTVSAWGPRIQADAARLVVGIVGLGSVGSLIAEAVARMGLADVRLIDFDSLETVNLDRVLHGKKSDIGRAKVAILAEELVESATAESFRVTPVEYSVVEERGLREALDCDVLFSCVDRPWARHVLNFIAYAHLIPVVDGGIRAEAVRSGDGLRRADIRAHVAVPGRECLECIGQYDSGLVSPERDGYLDDPAYIAGLPAGHIARRNENVFAFSMQTAALQLAQFISLHAKPLGIGNPGWTMYHLVNNSLEAKVARCRPNCFFDGLIAKGERSGFVFTGAHPVAERARDRRTEVGADGGWRGLVAWIRSCRSRWR